MGSSIRLAASFAVAQLLPVLALPRPQAGVNSAQNVNIPPVDPAPVPGASGALRGPTSLLGFNPSIPEATKGSTNDVGPFEVPEGSTEDEDLGLYLDMTNVQNPQPIRGANGKLPTDPGPRKLVLNSDISKGADVSRKLQLRCHQQ
jgi:hypothetical protein